MSGQGSIGGGGGGRTSKGSEVGAPWGLGSLMFNFIISYIR